MATVLSSKPIQAKELFLKNVEFATKFDLPAHLNMYSTNLTFIELYNLDLLAIGFVSILIFVYLFYRFVKLVGRCLCRSRPKKAKVE